MTVYHFVFENKNLYIIIFLFMIHRQKNTYCTSYYYYYQKIVCLHECRRKSNQNQIKYKLFDQNDQYTRTNTKTDYTFF